MTDPLEFAADLVKSTGRSLLAQQRAGGWEASFKPDRSLVTSADLNADRLISAEIQAAFPEDAILTEEQNPHTASGGHPLWVVDPLDGTTNFSLGLPIWGVLLARLVDGLPDTAAAYFPALDELYTARRGCGAWFNGRPLRTEPPTAERPISFFACCSRTHRRYHVTIPYKTRILGSAAYSFCAVARGIAVVAFEVTPMVWDLAAPWLLVQEAGGTIAPLEGTAPFPPPEFPAVYSGPFPTLAAASATEWEKARGRLIRK